MHTHRRVEHHTPDINVRRIHAKRRLWDASEYVIFAHWRVMLQEIVNRDLFLDALLFRRLVEHVVDVREWQCVGVEEEDALKVRFGPHFELSEYDVAALLYAGRVAVQF
jgi:hypothetical protein